MNGWERLGLVTMFAVGLSAAAPGHGSPPAAPADANPAPRDRVVTPIRKGSLLQQDKPAAPAVDLRSDFERRRDQELVMHYQRMAQLDVIAELAQKNDDLGLLEYVEDVRHEENQRFRVAMMRLREVGRSRPLLGKP